MRILENLSIPVETLRVINNSTTVSRRPQKSRATCRAMPRTAHALPGAPLLRQNLQATAFCLLSKYQRPLSGANRLWREDAELAMRLPQKCREPPGRQGRSGRLLKLRTLAELFLVPVEEAADEASALLGDRPGHGPCGLDHAGAGLDAASHGAATRDDGIA